VERGGVRRKLLKAQAEAGDIVLLFGDESEALTHPYLAHAWAKKGADLRIPAPGQAAKVAILGVLDWAPRNLVVRTSRTKRSTDVIALLEDLDRRYGPQPGMDRKPVVLVLDNGPIGSVSFRSTESKCQTDPTRSCIRRRRSGRAGRPRAAHEWPADGRAKRSG
jgi:hypothetical protein